MSLIALFNLSLWATVLTAFGAAVWLWSRRNDGPGLSALAVFCLAMAGWCLGHFFALNNQAQFALPLILANPLLPTTFLHFVIVWLKDLISLPMKLHKRIPLFYVVAIFVTIVSVWKEGAYLAPWLIFPSFFHLAFAGWINLAYTIAVGVLAHILLLYGYRHSQGNQRRSIISIFVVGAWGFLLATSFILPSLSSNYFPYPMLALPSYAVLVVYAVVRYRLVEANRWVSLAIQWLVILLVSMLLMSAFLALLEPLGIEELSNVPVIQLLMYSSVLLLIAWCLYGPAKRFSDRVVYPGATIEEATLNMWVNQLNRVSSWQDLANTIENMWLQRGGSIAGVSIINEDDVAYVSSKEITQFTCYKGEQWHCHLNGWQDVTPAKQHIAEILAALLPSTCASLERSLQLAQVEAQAERQRLEQRHLVELGGLSAAISHELRNPLNIINMASAQTEPMIKSHIQNQVARAELLIKDILSYASNIELHKEKVDLMVMIHEVITQIRALFKVDIQLQAPKTLIGNYDVARLQQVLINILENSASFINQQTDGQILLSVEQLDHAEHDSGQHQSQPTLMISIHNNGPSIPATVQQHLFEPFISKRSGGSGLGLSIVRRIVDAHFGTIEFRENCGWPVSFIVCLPEYSIHEKR